MNTKTYRPRRKLKKKLQYGTILTLTLALMLFAVIPVIWFVLVSFQPKDVVQTGGLTLRFTPTLENYVTVFNRMQYFKFFGNSTVICLSATLVVVVLASMAAYTLTRKKTKFTRWLSYWILTNKMFPPIAIVLPIYLMMAGIGWLDSYHGIILVYIAANLPYAVWMLISFFEDIPISLDEAGMIDGCSNRQLVTRVILPLAGSGLLATGIFVFVLTWSEFLSALLLTGTNTKTLPVAIAAFINDRGIEWGNMAAAGTTLILPLAVMFYSIQKYLVRGMAFGAVKE